MRKFIIATLLALMLVLAGCGGGAGGPTRTHHPIHYADKFPHFTPNVPDVNGVIRDEHGTIIFVPQPYPADFDWNLEGWPPPAPVF